VRLLLDTHILLWSLADSPRLSANARALLADTANECWVSAASLWEIAIKVMLGRYRLRFALPELESAVEESGYRALDVNARHALAIERIRIPHADPFDRLLLAQCEIETFRLLSADRLLATLPTVLRAD
jgi:PIN domain nuclease of toxin-antitoxin system